MIHAGVVRGAVIGLIDVVVVVGRYGGRAPYVRRGPQTPILQTNGVDLSRRNDDSTRLIAEISWILFFKQGRRRKKTGRDALDNPQRLGIDEEECLVFSDGSSEGSAELVLPVFRARRAG